MTTQSQRARAFLDLHRAEGAFVIPNPWDVGSARLLRGLGFRALATTSSGFAHSLGRLDGEVSLEEKIAHCRSLCEAVDVPVSADLERCFADEPAAAARNLVRAAGSGIAGASIEDYTGDPASPVYDFELAVERVHAAVEAVRALDFHFVLTARAEGLLRGHGDLDDAIRRLQAFEAAGADVLYAPALRTLDEVRAVTGAVSKPVNVLAPSLEGATVAALAEAGAKRISVGGALARAAIGATLRAGREMLDEGGFGWLAGAAGGGDVASLLR